jgi:hypothetical protein
MAVRSAESLEAGPEFVRERFADGARGRWQVSISYAQRDTQFCSACGKAFETEVWLLVDVDAREDLRERVIRDTIHDIACSHCGATVLSARAPLVVYQPGEKLIIFSPAPFEEARRNQEQARQLLGMMQRRLGEQFRRCALVMVPRQRLGLAVVAGLPRAAEDGGEPRPPVLLEAYHRFAAAPDTGTAREVLEAHPRLLSEDFAILMEQFLAQAVAAGDAEAIGALEKNRELLQRCREVGIDAALQERLTGRGEEAGESAAGEASAEAEADGGADGAGEEA